ncbi:MAG: flippase-like domain-containing protein [Candidatus Omnitrophica bacterium]|nr:flippase-like domain-containing protein [Candidatus Omnitrophota bacterium]
MTRKTLFTLFRIFVSLFFLGLLFWLMRDKIDALLEAIASTNVFLFSVCLGIQILVIVAAALRFKIILSAQKTTISAANSIALSFIGLFFNNFLPTALGGDLVRGYYASKDTGRTPEIYSAILMDRFCGFVPLVAMALVGIAITFRTIQNQSIIFAVTILCLLFVAAALVAFHPAGDIISTMLTRCMRSEGLAVRLGRFFYAIRDYRHNKAALGKSIVLSLGIHLIIVGCVFLLIKSIAADIGILHLFWSMPLIFTLSMLPSLNGLGIRESAFVYFLKSAIGPEKALAIALLWLALFYITSIIGGVVYLLCSHQFNITINQLKNEEVLDA